MPFFATLIPSVDLGDRREMEVTEQ